MRWRRGKATAMDPSVYFSDLELIAIVHFPKTSAVRKCLNFMFYMSLYRFVTICVSRYLGYSVFLHMYVLIELYTHFL